MQPLQTSDKPELYCLLLTVGLNCNLKPSTARQAQLLSSQLSPKAYLVIRRSRPGGSGATHKPKRVDDLNSIDVLET